jgi:hypothetical protein
MIVFVTDDGMGRKGTGPILYLADRPDAYLPPHPRSMEWRYFATMDSDDAIVDELRPQLVAALMHRIPFVVSHLIAGPRVASVEWEPQGELN